VSAADDDIVAIFFDIGETLLDRSREYAAWARWLGLPPHTFSAVFGAVIAQGGSVLDVLHRLGCSGDFATLRARMLAQVGVPALAECDLYPGTRAALQALHDQGHYIAVAGNQPREIGGQLRALELPVDAVLVSAELGVAKPSIEFFQRLLATADCSASAAVYVGDQLDNDVVAPARAGLRTVRVLTGPWGQLCRDATVESSCLAVVDSVADLPALHLGRTA
jgi:HAD superfamily hydrolase (TIGR01662 family)